MAVQSEQIMLQFDKFIPGGEPTAAGAALAELLRDESPERSYSEMMRYRIAGKASQVCSDTYFVCRRDGVCVSRLWHGWGKHQNPIGNFGNFKTDEQLRGQGIGKKLLQMWYEDLMGRQDQPLALFCTTTQRAAKLYVDYGFRPALPGTEYGPFYMPLGDSPATFREFCQQYYQPADHLICRPATVQWRHEIDLLLKFALLDRGLSFGIGTTGCLEVALLYAPGTAQLLFTPDGHCVGWKLADQLQIYPAYQGLPIEE